LINYIKSAGATIGNWLDIADTAINRINSTVFIYLILCLNLVSQSLSSNEEAYFGLAKQFVNPNWIPDSFIYSSWPGTRTLYYLIAGPLLNMFSFAEVAFVSDLVLLFIFSFIFSKLFKDQLHLDNLYMLLFFQIFLFPIQSFFGGEWILGGFEPKVLSYIFVFTALIFLFKEKYYTVIGFLAIATYFHVLVAGYTLIAVLIYLFLYRSNIIQIIKLSGLYVLLVAPFILYFQMHMDKIPSHLNGISYNWLISYFRVPHIVGMFSSLNSFIGSQTEGILITISAVIVSMMIIQQSKKTDLNKLNLFAFSLGIILVVNMAISVFDQNGVFVKYFPFRLSALHKFSFILVIIVFFNSIISPKVRITINRIIIVFVIPIFILNSSYNIYRIFNPPPDRLENVVDFVVNNTVSTDKFIIVVNGSIKSVNNEFLAFSRKTRRDRFVEYKIMPRGETKIYEWYHRIEEKKKVEKNIKYINTLRKKYKLDYLITDQEANLLKSKKVYFDKNTNLSIYKL